MNASPVFSAVTAKPNVRTTTDRLPVLAKMGLLEMDSSVKVRIARIS